MSGQGGVDYYQALASEALAMSPTAATRVMIWLEIERGATTAEVFCHVEGEPAVRYLGMTVHLAEIAYAFWKDWSKTPGNSEWRGFVVRIADGRFDCEILYPKKFDTEDFGVGLRQQAVEACFGISEVDYDGGLGGAAEGLARAQPT